MQVSYRGHGVENGLQFVQFVFVVASSPLEAVNVAAEREVHASEVRLGLGDEVDQVVEVATRAPRAEQAFEPLEHR